MDRVQKRGNFALEAPSFIPTAPEPTWEPFEDEEFDDPVMKFRWQLDPRAMGQWVDEVERLMAQGAVTEDELAAYEQKWVQEHHMNTAREEPIQYDFRRRWMARTFMRWERTPEGGHDSPTWLAASRQHVLYRHNIDVPWRAKEYELRQYRVPEYVPRHSEWSERELLNAGGTKREWNPEQRNMHIYYPPGPNRFAVHGGLEVPRQAPGIINEHIDVSGGVRNII